MKNKLKRAAYRTRFCGPAILCRTLPLYCCQIYAIVAKYFYRPAALYLIYVRDIGAVAAEVLLNFHLHIAQVYELTTPQNITFNQIAQLFSVELKQKITYHSPTLWSFFFRKKQEGTAVPFIFIMMLLHFLPRFQKPPRITNWVQQITGKAPRTLAEFICDHQALIQS